MPLYAISSPMLILPSVFSRLSQSPRIFFIRSTALSSVFPLPMSMASNSAFVSDVAPAAASFSLGLSSSDHLFIDSLAVFPFPIPVYL